MQDETLQTIYSEYFTPSLAKATDLLVERGEGAYLITASGERYIDFVQGIAVNALGHGHPRLIEAAYEQIRKLVHGSFNLVSYPSALRFAVELKKWLPVSLEMFFFTNTGAESVEGGLKLAKFTTRRTSVIAFRGGFHGRTMGAASVTSSNVGYRRHYAPFVPEVYFAPYPYCFRCPFGQAVAKCHLECFDYLREDFHYAIPSEDVSAILFEPVMGEGGYIVPPTKYVQALRHLCDELHIPLIFDEVQTGMGRTGKMFACQVHDVTPDIICLGKAVGGGFPLGVIASTRERMLKWEKGSHGTTFGGHPVACAAALAQLEILAEPGFLEDVAKKGEAFRDELNRLKERFPVIGDVRGLGLMNAIELVKEDNAPHPEAAALIQKSLMERRILVLTCGTFKNVLRFIPPLNVERVLLEEVLESLTEILKTFTSDFKLRRI